MGDRSQRVRLSTTPGRGDLAALVVGIAIVGIAAKWVQRRVADVPEGPNRGPAELVVDQPPELRSQDPQASEPIPDEPQLDVERPRSHELVLLTRIEDSFREVYLTLISIIQGVAFGFAAERAFASPHPTGSQQIGYIICFVVIVTVWQEYMVGSVAFTWTPTLLDAVIPYGLGVTEYLMVLGVRAPAWTFLMRFVLFVGVDAMAYVNWFVRAKWGGEFNRASYQALGGYVRFGVTYSLAACVMSLGLLWAYSLNPAHRDWLYLAVSLAAVLPLFIHSIWQWSVPLHGIHRRKRTYQRFADAVGLVDDEASPIDPVAPARPIDYRDQFKAAKYIREIVDNLSGDWSWRQTTRGRGVLRRAKGFAATRWRRRSRSL